MSRSGARRAPRPPSGLRFLTIALLVPAVLILAIFWIQNETVRGEGTRQEARASYARRFAAIELLAELNDAETNQRGYVITGDPEFRNRYHKTRDDVLRRIDSLAAGYRDGDGQAVRMAKLRGAAQAKFAEMEDVVRLRDTAGEIAASNRVRAGLGKRLMDQVRTLTNNLIQAEIKTGELRVAAYRERTVSTSRSMWLLLAGGSIALALALFLLWRQRREHYVSALQAFDTAERNQTILDSTVDAILILNPSGTIETMNLAATRMLGYRPEDLVRRDIGVLADIAPGTGSFHERIGLIKGSLRNTWLTDRFVRHRDGHLISVDIALGVMALPDGEHIVASLRDIAERKRLEKLKDEFISTVSHELRSPLTSIVGALGLLAGQTAGQLSTQATRLVQIADDNARRLIRLINDMLDVDRMDSGKLRLSMRQMDLRDVVIRGCEGNQGLAEAYHARIKCLVPDDMLDVLCDEERLIQVLTNLTSNALKVTPRDGTVRVGVIRDTDSGQMIVHVDDEGPGVPAEFRERIFGRFERADNDESTTGTGLGLAIAREIVALHGGTIWFEDRSGGGTRFAFSIPALREARLSDAIGPEAKILILDRDEAAAARLRGLLSDEGYDCRVVASAEAARHAIAQNGLSLLLVDASHADHDALSFAREVRAMNGPEKLSVLVTSGSGSDADALDLVDWIEKPIDGQRLKAAVRAALGHSTAETPVVLHLDDDNDTLEVTASSLQDDATILKARTLDEARALLRHYAPDLVILDVHLTKGSGLDLLPELFDGQGLSIPTIIYSAHDVSMHIAENVDAVILKSRSAVPDLKATIRRIMANRHRKGRV
jgi:PAS domain S-box-containing protein